MDSETKQLLEELKVALAENKRKPLFQSILQSVIVALIVAIPTAVTVVNKFENRIIKIEENQINVKDEFRRKEFKIDFNFRLIESKNPELKFIPITE